MGFFDLNAVAAASAGAPGPAPSGNVTATDPLGLSVDNNINWIIDTPAPAGATPWHPGHYLKLSGDPMDPNYWTDIATKIGNLTAPYIGVHLATAWGDFNTTGSTYDWTNMDNAKSQILTQMPGAYIIWQVQFKSFGTSGEPITLEAPIDLHSEVETANRGYTTALWRNNVATRFADALNAIVDRYAGDGSFEILCHSESAPSFSQVPNPPDYSPSALADQLGNTIWPAVAANAVGKVNFCPFLNSLGGGTGGNQVPALMEQMYQLRIGHGGPDAQPTYAWRNYEGESLGGGSPPAVRDYRFEIPSLNIISQQVLDAADPVEKSPAAKIDFCQIHQTTHLSWIDYGANGYSSQDYIDAINADPNLNNACPNRYLDGCNIT